MKFDKISVFQFKGQQIEMLYRKGSLAYSFEKEGKTYGIALKVPSKSVIDIASTTFQLITNAIETIEKLNENQ